MRWRWILLLALPLTAWLLVDRFVGELSFRKAISSATAVTRFEAPTIAVINFEAVFAQANRREELEAEIAKEYQARATKLESLKNSIVKIRTEMSLLKPGSPDYQKLEEQAVQQRTQFDLFEKRYAAEFEEVRSKRLNALIEEISEVAREVARDRDIDLVLQTTLSIAGYPWNSVVHADERLDITKDVIALLNKN